MRGTAFVCLLLGLAGCAGPVQQSLSSAANQRSGSDAAEQAGTLTLVPDRPTPGQRIEALYRPATALAAEPRLHLRARQRTSQDDSYNGGMGSRTIAVLARQRDGTYRGTFSLPTEVVYGVFAVEDMAVTRTDSREGRFWELLMHDRDGRPAFEALEQRFNDHMGRDELAVLESAREMVRLHPENPRGWTSLLAAEGWVLGDQGAEQRQLVHRERLAAFDRALAERQDLAADESAYLYWYARMLRGLAAHWRNRLMSEYPGHFFAVQDRVMDLLGQHREEPAALLRELEALWRLAEGREARARIVSPAFAAARQAGGSGTLLAWADRFVQTNPSAYASVATHLSGIAVTREEGIRRLRAEIATVEQAPVEQRPLGATAAEHRENATRGAANLRTSLGRALLAAGRIQEGIAALEKAASVGWNTSRFQSLGEARLSSGDHEGATRAFAAIAADPGVSGSTRDTLRLVLNVEAGPWDEAVAIARADMVQRTLQSARAESLPPARVARRDGSYVSLAELMGDNTTVVVFWSRYCGFSVQAMPRIAALSEQLARDGARLLALTRDSPAEAEPYLQDGGWDLHVLFDTDGEAARALNSWGTPQYFVLGRDGRLYFASSSLDDLLRQIAALQTLEAESE
jgi:peroxiredoxin